MRRFLFSLTTLLTACRPVQAVEYKQISHQGQGYLVTTLDPARDQLQLFWKNPSTGRPFYSFRELRDHLAGRGKKLLFATNSGIYTPEYAPLGLHIEQGKTLVKLNHARSGGNFALRPNGVFWLRGNRAGVTETEQFARLNIRPNYATQSGPLLLQGGKLHPEFNRSSPSFKLRSGVGVCRDGRVRFVISDGPVNFYTFATFFRDKLGCPNALYLDGSISAVYTPRLGDGQLVDFAGIWGVVDK